MSVLIFLLTVKASYEILQGLVKKFKSEYGNLII